MDCTCIQSVTPITIGGQRQTATPNSWRISVTNLEPVQRRDYLGIAIYAGILYAIVLSTGGPLTLHEGVLSQTTRAMLANHDWLVPRYGDAPWLERPPL